MTTTALDYLEQRTYAETHPWLRFSLDLGHCLPRFWMLLGETRSKCEHIKYVPLRQDTAERLMNIYFAKGVNATTAIEGNTLTEDQVLERMEGQLRLPPSQEYLGQEIGNMLDAYNEILERVRSGEHIPVSVDELRHLNRRILHNLDAANHVLPGELRRTSVAAGPYSAPRWGEVEGLLTRLCEWLETGFDYGDDESMRIPYAFIKAVVAHVYVEWVHPFGDGNGRLGRLVEFLVLISSGVPATAAHILTSHYNDTRTAYYRELHTASRNGGDLRPFLLYAAQGLVDGLLAAIERLHTQQEALMWQALVDEEFVGKNSDAAHRQRLLAIELGRIRRPVRRSELRTLTTQLAAMFAGKTSKTVSRDVNRLKKLDLIRVNRGGCVANLELVGGMRPFVTPPT